MMIKFSKCFILLSFIITATSTPIYSSNYIENNTVELSDLESYYLNKMTIVYVDGYDVDDHSHLIMSQCQFESRIKEVSNEMLEDGLNRLQIDRIKNEARKIGQKARRSKDMLIESLKKKDK